MQSIEKLQFHIQLDALSPLPSLVMTKGPALGKGTQSTLTPSHSTCASTRNGEGRGDTKERKQKPL